MTKFYKDRNGWLSARGRMELEPKIIHEFNVRGRKELELKEIFLRILAILQIAFVPLIALTIKLSPVKFHLPNPCLVKTKNEVLIYEQHLKIPKRNRKTSKPQTFATILLNHSVPMEITRKSLINKTPSQPQKIARSKGNMESENKKEQSSSEIDNECTVVVKNSTYGGANREELYVEKLQIKEERAFNSNKKLFLVFPTAELKTDFMNNDQVKISFGEKATFENVQSSKYPHFCLELRKTTAINSLKRN